MKEGPWAEHLTLRLGADIYDINTIALSGVHASILY